MRASAACRRAARVAALLIAGAGIGCEERTVQPVDGPVLVALRYQPPAPGIMAVQLRIDALVLETRPAPGFRAWADPDGDGGQLIVLSDVPLPADPVTLAYLVVHGPCGAHLITVAGVDLEPHADSASQRLSCIEVGAVRPG